MKITFQIGEEACGSYRILAILRWTMVFIFVWFGTQKFSSYASEAIAPMILHSPLMSWLGIFGVGGQAMIVGTIELTTALMLIAGAFLPIASALGAAMASATFLITLSFVFTTPGITRFNLEGFPIVSELLEMFLIKDVVLLAVSIVLLLASIKQVRWS